MQEYLAVREEEQLNQQNKRDESLSQNPSDSLLKKRLILQTSPSPLCIGTSQILLLLASSDIAYDHHVVEGGSESALSLTIPLKSSSATLHSPTSILDYLATRYKLQYLYPADALRRARFVEGMEEYLAPFTSSTHHIPTDHLMQPLVRLAKRLQMAKGAPEKDFMMF